jgi:hypothetical protein
MVGTEMAVSLSGSRASRSILSISKIADTFFLK